MKFGMTDEQFELLDRLVIQPLKNQKASVFIFGSRTTDKFHPHSDVDLLYDFSDGGEIPAGMISQLKENIENSHFPFTVDLVAKDDLVESYRRNVEAQLVRL